MSETNNPPARKPLSTSVLDGLAPEQRTQLNQWLDDENRGYDEVRELVASTFGVQTSRSALGRYYEQWILPRRLMDDAEELSLWNELQQADYDDSSLLLARRLGFHALAGREPDVKTATRLFRIIRAGERMQLARDRIKLEERRVALSERVVPQKRTLLEIMAAEQADLDARRTALAQRAEGEEAARE